MPLQNDDRDGLRRCRDCNEWKPLAEFHKNPRRPSGRGSYCQPCFNARSKASYAKRVAARHGRTVKPARVVPHGERYCPDCDSTNAICGAPDPEHVDHDHRTGYIRGILCFNCNGGLGQFRDNVGYLNQAVDYLRATACLVPAYPYPGVFRVRTPRQGMAPVRRGDERGRGAATSLAID